MDIHHAMTVLNNPVRLYEALTQQRDLEIWLGEPTLAQQDVGSTLEFLFGQGQRTLRMVVTRLEAGKQVQWWVIQPVWPQDDQVYPGVSYKWASYMIRLKIYMGDTREVATFLPTEDKKITANKSNDFWKG